MRWHNWADNFRSTEMTPSKLAPPPLPWLPHGAVIHHRTMHLLPQLEYFWLRVRFMAFILEQKLRCFLGNSDFQIKWTLSLQLVVFSAVISNHTQSHQHSLELFMRRRQETLNIHEKKFLAYRKTWIGRSDSTQTDQMPSVQGNCYSLPIKARNETWPGQQIMHHLCKESSEGKQEG